MATLKPDQPKKWIGYFECFMIWIFCIINSTPMFFKFEMKKTNITNMTQMSDINTNLSCWSPKVTQMFEISENNINWTYFTYNVISQSISRVLPAILIITLNIMMYQKIKVLFNERQKLFESNTIFNENARIPQQQKQGAEIFTVTNNTNFPNHVTIFQEHFKKSSNSADILEKILKKW